MRGDYNVFFLVGAIKGLTFKFDGHKHPSHTLDDAKRYFYHYYYIGHTTNPQHPETFNHNVSVIESNGGAVGTDPGLTN